MHDDAIAFIINLAAFASGESGLGDVAHHLCRAIPLPEKHSTKAQAMVECKEHRPVGGGRPAEDDIPVVRVHHHLRLARMNQVEAPEPARERAIEQQPPLASKERQSTK